MIRLILIILSLVLFSSCGNTLCEKNVVENKEIRMTKGQELIDLKKALDEGALTPQEYEKLKKEILDRGKGRKDKKKRK